MFASPAASESIHTPRRRRPFKNASHRRQRFSSGRWQKHNTCCQTMQLGVPDVPMQPYGCCITCQAAAEATAHLSNARPVSTCRALANMSSSTAAYHKAKLHSTKLWPIPNYIVKLLLPSAAATSAATARTTLQAAAATALQGEQRRIVKHPFTSILLPAS